MKTHLKKCDIANTLKNKFNTKVKQYFILILIVVHVNSYTSSMFIYLHE